jgi:5-formyltetrahydrofolate cyclo-ligase
MCVGRCSRVRLPLVASFTPIDPTGLTAGELRERIWSELVRQNAAAYPMPPHGHNPNFKGALAAAKRLMQHPLMLKSGVVLVGMEAALGPVRALLLERGVTIIVPHRTKAGRYWRVKDAPKAAAKLPNLPVYGLETGSLEDAALAVIASTAVTETGMRLSKGFGWSSDGPPVHVPALTVAHSLMVFKSLDLEMDSEVAGFATPERLVVPGVHLTART